MGSCGTSMFANSRLLGIIFIFCIATAFGQRGDDSIFKGLGLGGKAALAVIKNLCGTEPPVACTCQPEDGENEDENDLDNVEVLRTPLPSCIPETCICPDGSEQPLPSLPKRVLKKVARVLEKISARIQSKLTNVCENGRSPSTCECENVLMDELKFPVEDDVDIVRCRPTRCTCTGQGPNGEDEVVVIHPGRILFNQFLNNVCSGKSGFDITSIGSNEQSLPEKCSCTNGTDVVPPYTARQMKFCQPDSCTCPGENGGSSKIVEINLDGIKEKAKFIKKKFKKLNKICANDTPPTSCKCLDDSANTITPPFDDPLTILECLPKKCFCADGTKKKINLMRRNSFLNRFGKLCDNKLPQSCTCEDESTIEPNTIASEVLNGELPDRKDVKRIKRQLKKAFKRCKATSCTCPNGVTKPITIFGCKEGGFPKCPTTGSTSTEDKPVKLKCTDGTLVKPLQAVLAQSKGKCVCKDGNIPSCLNGEALTCPNGDSPDLSIAEVPELFSDCKGN